MHQTQCHLFSSNHKMHWSPFNHQVLNQRDFFNLLILWDQSPFKFVWWSNLPFLNRHFKKLSKSDKSQKKAKFMALRMEQIRVIHATPKAKTKILSQKRKTPNDSKGKSSQKARLIQKIMKKKTWLVKSLMVHWI